MHLQCPARIYVFFLPIHKYLKHLFQLQINDVSLLCIATGWPTPSYRWYKEVYRNNTLVALEVDPLSGIKEKL